MTARQCRDYRCSKCGTHKQKLWRQYQTVASAVDLLCYNCACVDQNKESIDLREHDQIGSLVPAIPTEDGETFWGYTSVPSAGVAWWWRLPPDSQEREVVPEKPRPTPPDYTAQVEYCIEGESNTSFTLWREWHAAFNSWEQVNPGFWQQIGHGKSMNGEKMPICVGVDYARIDGHLVAFVYGTSKLVDHDAIAEWRRKTFRSSKGVGDAMNFHNCIFGLGIKIKKKHERCSGCGVDSWRA